MLSSTVRELPGKSPKNFRGSLGNFPEGPKIEKIQSRDTRLKNSRFQSRNEIFDREWFFQSDPSLAAEKQGLGLKFSIENENVEPRMKSSSENVFFVRVGMVFFFKRSSENDFFRSLGPLGSGDFPEARGSLTPSQRLAKFVSLVRKDQGKSKRNKEKKIRGGQEAASWVPFTSPKSLVISNPTR